MPWHTKEAVARHNRRAAADPTARKIWMRVANAALKRGTADKWAIIAANIAVNKYFASRKRKKNPPGEFRELDVEQKNKKAAEFVETTQRWIEVANQRRALGDTRTEAIKRANREVQKYLKSNAKLTLRKRPGTGKKMYFVMAIFSDGTDRNWTETGIQNAQTMAADRLRSPRILPDGQKIYPLSVVIHELDDQLKVGKEVGRIPNEDPGRYPTEPMELPED
jgi:hypothetical protein